MLKLRVCGNGQCGDRISYQASTCEHCGSPQERAAQRFIVLERELFAIAAEEREQQTIADRYRSQMKGSVGKLLNMKKNRDLQQKVRHYSANALRMQFLKEEKMYEIEALEEDLAILADMRQQKTA